MGGACGTMCDVPTGTRLHPTAGRIHSLAAFVRFLCSSSFFHSRTEGDPRMPCLSFPTGLVAPPHPHEMGTALRATSQTGTQIPAALPSCIAQ